MCIAALDCGDLQTAEASLVKNYFLFSLSFLDNLQESLGKLQKRFPDTVRVLKLEGMCLEGEGDFDKAIELYDSALQKHPTNAELKKRKICVLKALGKTQEAITELSEFLKV